MIKPSYIHVIPAQPNTREVGFDGANKALFLGDPIIAYRYETYDYGEDGIFTELTVLTINGESSGCIGVQNHDRTVTLFEDSTYISLAEAHFAVKSRIKSS